MGVAESADSTGGVEPAKRFSAGVSFVIGVALLLGFVLVAILVRGREIGDLGWITPDEAEFMAQARAAMLSPIPFTTWTTTTTGPIWVWFLALLGWAGAPMTIVFTHLLAAIMWGVMGFCSFVLMRRAFRWWLALILTLFWWLPIVMVVSLAPIDIAGLDTELLPGVFLLIAACVSPRALERHPSLYLVVGLLCGLAIASKYQVGPLVIGLLAIQLLAKPRPWRTLVKPVILWAIGAIAPMAVFVLIVVFSPAVSREFVTENLNFLTGYSANLTPFDRLRGTGTLLSNIPNLVILLGVVAMSCLFSIARTAILRVAMVALALASVFFAGYAASHYAIFVYLAAVIALSIPLDRVREVEFMRRPLRVRVIVGTVALAAALVASLTPWDGFPYWRAPTLTSPAALATSLSPQSVERDPVLEAACPPGSQVVVWGWASELYVNYDWRNGIPFFNVSQLTMTSKNYLSGSALMRSAIENPTTKCVIDAVGKPFFSFDAKESLTQQYPSLASILGSKYTREAYDFPCQSCSIFVAK